MNAALLVMSSALGAGGDVVPAGWGERPPVVVQAGGCCAPAPTVPAPCDACGSGGRTRLLDRIKGRFGGRSKGSACCDPCGTTSYSQPNLFDKMESRWSGRKTSSGCGCPTPCGPACGPSGAGFAPGCAAPAMPPVVTVPVNPPKEMPKDPKGIKDPKDIKDSKANPDPDPVKKGNGGNVAPPPSAAPRPNPVALPPLPVSPVSGPKLSGSNSPY